MTIMKLIPLIRAALIHYQFETIHPFSRWKRPCRPLADHIVFDGEKVLTTPALYISYFLKKNRVEYYDRMTEVRAKGNYEQWVKFFLEAIIESAEDATATIDKLIALHEANEAVISKLGRAAKKYNVRFLIIWSLILLLKFGKRRRL